MFTAIVAASQDDHPRAADHNDSGTVRDRTSQRCAFVPSDQHLVQSCVTTELQCSVKQPFGALLQRCAVFDAAGSDNRRLDHSIGVIL